MDDKDKIKDREETKGRNMTQEETNKIDNRNRRIKMS